MNKFFRNFRSKSWTHVEQMKEQERIENLHFDTDEERFLFAEARLGLDAAEFWESDVGVYLRRRCAGVVRESMQKLAEIPPLDYEAIAKEQVNLKAARTLVMYITDAIQNGEASELEIQHREENNSGE